MKIPSSAAPRRARIEIIPLIDIIFFLLATFVMVSLSMVKNRAIAVNLPAAATAALQDRKAFAAVTVTQDGALYLDRQPVSLEDLAARLQEMQAANSDVRVFIHGDERASFGSAVRVLDQVRLIGITKVAIQTRTDKALQPDVQHP